MNIEKIRETGQVIMISEDKTEGLVEVHDGLMVKFIKCYINEDGTIKSIMPYRINTYLKETKISSIKKE